MFSRKCVCKLNISTVVGPLLAALNVNGLSFVPNIFGVIYIILTPSLQEGSDKELPL